ncbi:hypothetical protein E1295_27950 [Nonomuraea mesophila]|uniref:Uncharacterized protein n=1 Tax=Nonomuraea mesophila TaxID=2530382 RepID=A0A4R5F546_9ACTN|nr:hypothetical protein [Nonomuraea mesophila]TDE42402.1 hypothetical protein E1295_27950 [Nonomuraea mesophila]
MEKPVEARDKAPAVRVLITPGDVWRAGLLSLVDTFVAHQEVQESTTRTPPPPAGVAKPAPPK